MSEVAALLLAAGLAILLVWQQVLHEAERRRWEGERAALVERLTGVPLTPRLPAKRRAFGDRAEWEIESERNETREPSGTV